MRRGSMKKYHKINSIFKRDHRSRKFTDEYSTPEIEYLKDNIWEFTEKIDGTNVRIHWDGEKVKIGGRTELTIHPPFLQKKLEEIFIDELFKKEFPTTDGANDIMLYGEGYGNKIQKIGKLYIPDGVSFILFDVQIGHWWLQRKDVNEIAKQLNIRSVSINGEGTLQFAIDLVKSGKVKSNFGDFEAEGFVLRPKVNLLARSGNRIITKVKVKDFR